MTAIDMASLLSKRKTFQLPNSMVSMIIRPLSISKAVFRTFLKVSVCCIIIQRTIIMNLSETCVGHLNEEEEVLQWLITQKTEDRIELITRQMLETMVEDTQYLAVYFCKSACDCFCCFFLCTKKIAKYLY